MKIFILEDANDRIDIFMELMGKHDLTIIRDPRKANKMYKPPYDLLLLDHDLGLFEQDSHGHDVEITGQDFCRWLTHNVTVDRPAVIIHSWNPEGADRMLHILVKAGWSEAFKIEFGPTLLKTLRGL